MTHGQLVKKRYSVADMVQLLDSVCVGAQPIAWSNDDFLHLGADISLERCLSDMRLAGYAGTEMGHKFPKDVDELTSVLGEHGLELVSCWHSTYLLENPIDSELRTYTTLLDFLHQMGCSVIIVAECTGRISNDPTAPLVKSFGADLDDASMSQLADGLNLFGRYACEHGMKLVYHPHIGTLIQNDAEVDLLMERTDADLVHLVADTGHIAFAGGDTVDFFERHAHRIGHVHLKNVRQSIADRVWVESMSFERAVVEGVFTVPGDDEGSIDYVPLFEILEREKYTGWLVVEAEQNPAKADPFKYFTLAREYIKEHAGV